MRVKFGKPAKYAVGLIFFVLTLICVYQVIESKNHIDDITNQLNVLTDDVIKTIGGSPSTESIKQAKQLIDDRKDSIRRKIKALKDAGKLRTYSLTEDCSEANNCSETAKRIDLCYKTNHNKIAEFYNKFLDSWRKNNDKSNKSVQELLEKSDKTLSAKEKRRLEDEVEKVNKELEASIALLEEMDLSVRSYETITEIEEK